MVYAGCEMRLQEDVKLITELDPGAAELVRSVAEERRTVLLMDTGGAKAVLMDVASYDQWRDTVALLQLIAQSENDIEAGRVVSNDAAFARIELAITRAATNG
jgi:PHD/YefM family antitoxin component YafN of YafNO toxin-antitoxin module